MPEYWSAEGFTLLAAALAAGSGLPGLFLAGSSRVGATLATFLLLAGCACGAVGVGFALRGENQPLALPSPVPGSEFAVTVDPLSAVFLVPVLLVTGLGSVYGLGYWSPGEHADSSRRMRLFYGLLAGAMVVLLSARDGVLFLFAWEAMALAAYFLIVTEDRDPDVRRAGWIYLALSHFATLCLVGMFALMAAATGTFEFVPLAGMRPGLVAAVFVLALLGFGTKAGLMPLHVWLPGAHAMAPSHVSALMSGVVIKMGVYGIVRVGSLVPGPPLWFGGTLLTLGVVTGVLGIAFAVGQRDLKRLLAYSSIENVGIITVGLGLAFAGRALYQPAWVALGLGGALLHVWNHAAFKSLLFFGVGSVVHHSGTRDMERLGGLGRAMPRTALLFLVGAVAICALPPLNGFVSELLIYLGLFRAMGLGGGAGWAAAGIGVPALALIGALAAACFVKVYGIVFLGSPRSPEAGHAHESGPAMLVPMAVLAGCCVLVGVAPLLVAPVLDAGIRAWSPGLELPEASVAALAPLGYVTAAALALIALLAGSWAFLRWRIRAGGSKSALTWDCGYAAPSPRMQYTSSSFAQILIGLFGWLLRPREQAPKLKEPFPAGAQFHSETPDPALDEALLPASRGLSRAFGWSRYLQQGSMPAYLLYILAVVLVLLLWD